MLLLGGDSSYYGQHGIPIFFTSQAVQQVRWQEVLDVFSLQSAIPDMLNLRYLVVSPEQYREEQPQFGNRYVPVYTSPDGKEMVLENRNVLPKAWLVPSVLVLKNRQEILQVLQNPAFNPSQIALVESAPPIPLGNPGQQISMSPGEVRINRYEGEWIELTAAPTINSMLVIGEKYYQGWKARVDGKDAVIHPVDNILRGVYLTPGSHRVEFWFDPLPFRIGKYLTLTSFALYFVMLVREYLLRRRRPGEVREGQGG
jgi:hypothetical protein